MSLSKTPAASERSSTTTACDPGSAAQAWRELALDSLMAGEPASGLWFLRNAIEADADDPATWQLMGRCFEEMGEESRARKCYLLALRQHAMTASSRHQSPAATLSLSWRRRPTRDV